MEGVLSPAIGEAGVEETQITAHRVDRDERQPHDYVRQGRRNLPDSGGLGSHA